MSPSKRKWLLGAGLLLLGFSLYPTHTLRAEDAATAPAVSADAAAAPAAAAEPDLKTQFETMKWDNKVAMDTIWVLITGMLVFFMNLGFALVESGFARAKNCVNILSKNFIVFAASTVSFWAIGWGL